MGTIVVNKRESVEKEISCKKTVGVGAQGEHRYTKLETDKYLITLFNANAAPKENAGSRLKYNAKIIFRANGEMINKVDAMVRELTGGEDAGKLIIGQKSKKWGYAIVSDRKDNADGSHQYFDKVTVSPAVYAELTQILMAGDAMSADETIMANSAVESQTDAE